MAKQELLETIRDRYQAASGQEKSRIFDEFIAVVNDGLEMSHFYGLKLNHLVFAQRFGQSA